MHNSVRFEITNQLSELSTIAPVVSEFAAAQGLSSKGLYIINLVLDEIVTNIISYGFKDDRPHSIGIELGLEGPILSMEVTDDGHPFSIADAPGINVGLPLDERPIGGLGCHLVRKMMDEVHYERRAGCNHLRLTKNLDNLGPGSRGCSIHGGLD